ncbi:MAG: hypothetical protein AB1634_17005 [Thermodesulfobacteriota bacterium]
MSGRAMGKGVIRQEEAAIPVKLYAAVQERGIRFQLLPPTAPPAEAQDLAAALAASLQAAQGRRHG